MPAQPNNPPPAARFLLPIARRMTVSGIIIALVGLFLYKFGPRGVQGFPVHPEQAAHAILFMGITFFAVGAVGWLFLHYLLKKKTP